jgi:hypothetical protein
MGKNRSQLSKILNDIEAEENNDDLCVDPDDDYYDPDETRLLMMLWAWFRLWRCLGTKLKQDDYYDMENSAVCSLWKAYDKID